MKENKVLGVDIGGSHIVAAVVDRATGTVIEESACRRVINSQGTAPDILHHWVDAINAARKACPLEISHIGFAMPGPFDYENGICLIRGFNKYEALYGLDIRKSVSGMLDLPPENIVFRNDAACFLDGELLSGSVKGYKHAIGITLGTGLGSATSRHGVTRDAELSVLPYGREKIEEFVSTRGLIRIYRELTGCTVENVKDLAAMYDTDAKAREAFDIFSEKLAWFLCQFTEKEGEIPEVLVVGGNIALCWKLFMPRTIELMNRSSVHIPHITRAVNGEYAALVGAISPFASKTGGYRLSYH